MKFVLELDTNKEWNDSKTFGYKSEIENQQELNKKHLKVD